MTPAARLESQWREVVRELRHVGATYKLGALLRDCKEWDIQDGVITLKFAHSSHMERTEEELGNRASRDELKQVLSKDYGRHLRDQAGNGRRRQRRDEPERIQQELPGPGRPTVGRNGYERAGGRDNLMNRKMMRQAQQLQQQMAKIEQELESATVEASAGGGMVTVVVTGKMAVQSVTIDPEVVSPEDVDMLEGPGAGRRKRRPEQGPAVGRAEDGGHHRRPEHPRPHLTPPLSTSGYPESRLRHDDRRSAGGRARDETGRGVPQAPRNRSQDGQPADVLPHKNA